MERVVVTEESYRKGKAVFDAVTDLKIIVAADEEESAFADAVKRCGAKHADCGRDEVSRCALPGAAQGRRCWRGSASGTTASTNSAPPSAACWRRTPPGVLDLSVAEFAMLLIASTVRDVPRMAASMRGGRTGARLPGARLRARVSPLSAVGRSAGRRRGSRRSAMGCA